MITRSFSYSEFKCLCKRQSCKLKSGYQIDLQLVIKLQEIRDAYGRPMKINSALRCKYWNSKVGGKPLSYHLKGLAADIGVVDRRGKILIVKLALELGLSCGVYSWGIHLDNRPVQVVF